MSNAIEFVEWVFKMAEQGDSICRQTYVNYREYLKNTHHRYNTVAAGIPETDTSGMKTSILDNRQQGINLKEEL